MSSDRLPEGAGMRWWRPAAVAVAVGIAIVWRLIRQDLGAPPNLELVMAATLFSTMILRSRVAAFAPLVVVAISDLLLGNTSILLFTWSAWAMIGVGSLLTRRFGIEGTGGWRRYLAALGFGVGGTVWFFLWTNFGVWLLGWGQPMAGGFTGLVSTYINGIPFIRPQLLANIVLVPAAAGLVTIAERVTARRPAPLVQRTGE